MKICSDCGRSQSNSHVVMCGYCGSVELVEQSSEDYLREQEEQERERAEFEQILAKANDLPCFTVESAANVEVNEALGLVFGNSSKQAFWGLSTQANRLSRAYEAALINLRFDAASMGADAVVGVRFALNNSQGSANQLLAGSSEAVMLLGTAVTLKK